MGHLQTKGKALSAYACPPKKGPVSPSSKVDRSEDLPSAKHCADELLNMPLLLEGPFLTLSKHNVPSHHSLDPLLPAPINLQTPRAVGWPG